MRMEETCGDGSLNSCTGIVKGDQVNECITPLLAADSNISHETSNTVVPVPTQEDVDKDYCVEATKLILDLSK